MTDEKKKALDAIARIFNPHWPEGHRGSYHPHMLAELVEQQSARIAELEAENKRLRAVVKHAKLEISIPPRVSDVGTEEEFGRCANDLALMTSRADELEAERDAVRGALEWLAAHQAVTLFRDRIYQHGAFCFRHDGTGESVEAALLAAAREGGD